MITRSTTGNEAPAGAAGRRFSIQRGPVRVVFGQGASDGIAAEIEAMAPEQQGELIRIFEARAAPLMVDGALHSATVSNLVLARR